MKKSLVVLTVILASLALAGLVFAAGKACPPMQPMKCELSTSVEKGKPMQVMVPKKGKGTPGKCVTVPCPPMQVTVPGKPYAVANLPVPTWITDTAPVFRDICAGKSKGQCPAFCGPCAPLIKWSCNWKTSEECGKVAYKFSVPPGGKLERKPSTIAVKEKVVPSPVDCLW